MKREKRNRFFFFLAAGILHVLLLVFVVVPEAPRAAVKEEPRAVIIRLRDIREEIPPPLIPEPAPEIAAIEAAVEQLNEIDEPQEAPEEPIFTGLIAQVYEEREEEEEFLPMSSVSVLPRLPEDQIRRAIVYPPLAQRSRTEGIVYLELLIDPQGNIRNISIVQETPENRGFGEAALNALRNIRAIPGEADGIRVGVRFRYPIRFTLR